MSGQTSKQSEHILTTQSVYETLRLGKIIGQVLGPGDVIALNGMLGAGKTQLVRGIATGVGADIEMVSSPTFVLMQEYPGEKFDLIHIDAYRINTLSDLESVGWSDELWGSAALVCEWAEMIQSELPANVLNIEIEHTDENTRQVYITSSDAWYERIELIINQYNAN